MPPKVELADRIAVLRDEVLATADYGDREPPGAEVFEAIVRGLGIGTESMQGLDLTLHEAAARRLAWGETEESVLADANHVFERLLIAIDRSLRDANERFVVLEVASQVTATVARVVAMHAVQRAGKQRAARLREEMAQRQLRDAIDKHRTSLQRLKKQLEQTDFGEST